MQVGPLISSNMECGFRFSMFKLFCLTFLVAGLRTLKLVMHLPADEFSGRDSAFNGPGGE